MGHPAVRVGDVDVEGLPPGWPVQCTRQAEKYIIHVGGRSPEEPRPVAIAPLYTALAMIEAAHVEAKRRRDL